MMADLELTTDQVNKVATMSDIPEDFAGEDKQTAPVMEDLRSSLRKNPPKKPKHWTAQEDADLKQAVAMFGRKRWKTIAEHVPGRNHTQCLQRWSKVLTPGLKKGQWDADEDDRLVRMVLEQTRCESKNDWLKRQPRIRWGAVSKSIEGRTAKQCRERWTNHLNPAIVKGFWNPEEDAAILRLYDENPRKWAWIAKKIPGRTENAVKIRWKSLNDAQQRRKRGPYAVKKLVGIDSGPARGRATDSRPPGSATGRGNASWAQDDPDAADLALGVASNIDVSSNDNAASVDLNKQELGGSTDSVKTWPPSSFSPEILAQLVSNGISQQQNMMMSSFVGSPRGISPSSTTSPSSQQEQATQLLMKLLARPLPNGTLPSPLAGNVSEQVVQYLMLAQQQQQQQQQHHQQQHQQAQATALAQALAQSGINLQAVLQQQRNNVPNNSTGIDTPMAASSNDEKANTETESPSREKGKQNASQSEDVQDKSNASTDNTKDSGVEEATTSPPRRRSKRDRKRPRSAEEDSAANVLRDLQRWV